MGVFYLAKTILKGGSDERIPRGCRFHTVSCQNKVQTYQFDEINSN